MDHEGMLENRTLFAREVMPRRTNFHASAQLAAWRPDCRAHHPTAVQLPSGLRQALPRATCGRPSM